MTYPVDNPKKELTTNHPIQKVIDVVRLLPKHASSATLIHENETMGFFQYDAKGKGLFSLGMFIDIHLHSINENQTRIVIEGRRKFGWIDDVSELGETYNYIVGTLSMMGKGLRGELK